MIKVTLWGSLRSITGGLETVEVEARNTREMLEALAIKYPALGPVIESGVSVAVDGVIYREAWFTPLSENNEIVLMPYLTGG